MPGDLFKISLQVGDCTFDSFICAREKQDLRSPVAIKKHQAVLLLLSGDETLRCIQTRGDEDDGRNQDENNYSLLHKHLTNYNTF